jgi:hypothetical protein
MSCVEKWRQKAELWKRKQGSTESVDDYVAAMQAAAKRIYMPETYLADAIMQELQPELRLHVLHSKPETIDEILETARVSEVAHSANTASSSQMDTLNAKVDLLLTKIVANNAKTEDQTSTPEKVTFTQAVVATESTNRVARERAYSPATRSPSSSPVRSSGGYESSTGPPRREWSDYNQPVRRDVDSRRETMQNRRQPTSWRAPFNGQRSATSQQNISFQNQPFQRQSRFNSTLQQRLTGNYAFSGGSHQLCRQFCPAANLQCFNCSMMGHMARMRRIRSATQGFVPFDPQ